MPNFVFAFFLNISKTLEAHISGTETDINKQLKNFLFGFQQSFILANKNIIKNFDV